MAAPSDDKLSLEYFNLVKRTINKELDAALNGSFEGMLSMQRGNQKTTFKLMDADTQIYVNFLHSSDTNSRDFNALEVRSRSTIIHGRRGKNKITPKLIFVFTKPIDENELEFYRKRFEGSIELEYAFFGPSNFEQPQKETKSTPEKKSDASATQSKQSPEDKNIDLDALLNEVKESEAQEKLGSRKIWLGGHTWGDEDQLDRFVRDSIFETGEAEKALFDASVGDVLLMKSAFPVKKRSVLRIKAIGVVSENPLNGRTIQVQWYVLDNYYDFMGMGQYRRAFQRLMPRFYGKVLRELVDHEPRLFEIIATLTQATNVESRQAKSASGAPTINLEVRPEYPIDPKGTVMYGQQIGSEIVNYNIIILPKSIFGGIGPDGIAGHVLNLLKVDRTTLDFTSTNIDSDGYGWIPKKVGETTYYLGFVISKGEQSGAADFEASLVNAITAFPELFGEEAVQSIKRLFIPLLGAGQSKMGDLQSLSKVLSGVEIMRDIFKDAPIRINYSRDADEEKRIAFSRMVLERLALTPSPHIAALIEERDTRKINMIPKTLNDSNHGTEDLLGFETDIRVFASLMARSDLEPPFAIALFGAWGKGKSFFMSRLMRRVRELSEGGVFMNDDGTTDDISTVDDQVNYCDGIAQIHFNAWSYVDSNLWAGLVSTIFERLNEYLNDNSKSQVAKLQMQEALVDKLKALNTLSRNVRGKKDSFELLKKGYEQEKKNIEERNKQSFNRNILEILKADPKLAQLHNELLNIRTVSNDLLHRVDLKGAIEEADATKQFIQQAQKNKKWLLYIVVAILGSGASLFLAEYITSLTHYIQSIGTAISALALPIAHFGKFRNIANKVSKYRRLILQLEQKDQDVADALSEHRKLIEQADEEIRLANEQLEGLDEKIEKTEFDIQYNLIDITIKDFIEGRSEHEDYKSKTGIVSTIRRDFELLSELFIEREEEDAAMENVQSSEEDSGPIQRKMFKKERKLQRIILYIDDLDRCTDEKVLEVLQAVHLLMAFPLFMVVVGVDKRCVNNALRYRNILQYARQTRIEKLEDLKEHFKLEIIKPNEYLEKIFQIPYHIPEASNGDIQNMIKVLMEDEMIIKEEASLGEPNDTDATVTDDVSAMATEALSNDDSDTEDDLTANDDSTKGVEFSDQEEPETSPDTDISDQGEDASVSDDENESIDEEDSIIDLRISDWELTQIQHIVPDVVGSSPRTIKRFINVYRLIRAHGEYEHQHFSLEEKLLILFLVAIHTGCGENSDVICKQIYNAQDDVTLEQILKENEDQNLLKTLEKHNKDVAYQHLLKMKVKPIQDRIPMVRKFSFRERLNLNEIMIDDEA